MLHRARTISPARPVREESRPCPKRGASEPSRCASTGAFQPPHSIPALRFADSTVLSSSIAIVIGPTPPGTGLIQPAF